MTGPQDPAAAGGDRIRAGHADREQVIETLKTAFVQGRLTRDELGVRAGRALAALTCADLAALTADIPPGPAGAAGRAAPACPGAPPAAGQGGRRVGRLPGHRVRRRVGRRPNPRSAWPRQSLSSLEQLVSSRGLCRGSRGTVHPGARGGRLLEAEKLPRAAAAPAGAGRPRPGRRPARRRLLWPGFPPAPHRPDPRRPAGSRVTAAPAAHSRPGAPGSPRRAAGARRGMRPVKPAPGPVPPRLSRLGFTVLARTRFPRDRARKQAARERAEPVLRKPESNGTQVRASAGPTQVLIRGYGENACAGGRQGLPSMRSCRTSMALLPCLRAVSM